ncbi:MAG: DNA modification methylase [Phycisphaerae bacterium]|nr:DNA modification methylase [Phycisphaerae bacterium]
MKEKKQVNIGCPEIKKLALNALEPAEYNPRIISDDALAGLANSLERFGCVEPIVVNIRDGRNVIVGGHQRYKALAKAGVIECVCVVVDLSVADEKVLNFTLNNPEIQGKFIAQLDEYIRQLQTEVNDEQLMLDLRIAELASDMECEEKVGLTLDDEIPAKVKSRTKPGDLWILGDHRLLCGSSTNRQDVARLMDGNTADLFATDPPYCVDYTGADRPAKGKDWSDVYHEVDISDLTSFWHDFIRLGFEFVKENAAIYLWHASKKYTEIEKLLIDLKVLPHQTIIWVKPCAVMTYSFYSWRHEPCLLAWQKGKKPDFNPKMKSKGTIWPLGYVKQGDPETPEYYTDIWEMDWDGKSRQPGFEHPTVKPTEAFAIPMRMHTKPGAICYEPFCGSGTQFIAAEKLSRRCFGMEVETHFCDIAVKRWEDWTGKKAIKEKPKRAAASN